MDSINQLNLYFYIAEDLTRLCLGMIYSPLLQRAVGELTLAAILFIFNYTGRGVS